MITTPVYRSVLVIGCALILGALNFMIFAKERIVREGVSVYLALAPVDPRAILQGDFMTLRFELAAQLERDTAMQSALANGVADSTFRTAEITLDQRSIAWLARGDSSSDLRIRYRNRAGRIWLGTNAYFFQEGDAAKFEAARFGHFKLSKKTGEAILIGLVDEDFVAL